MIRKYNQQVNSKQGQISFQLFANPISPAQLDRDIFGFSESTKAIYIIKEKHLIYALSKQLLLEECFSVIDPVE